MFHVVHLVNSALAIIPLATFDIVLMLIYIFVVHFATLHWKSDQRVERNKYINLLCTCITHTHTHI